MKIIDCFGDICPVPILKIEKELSVSKKGDSFMVVVDHSCTIKSIEERYKKRRVKFIIDEVMNGVWEITFTVL